MPNSLYVYIDESGNVTQDDYYVVAGFWCVSSANNPTRVLDPTVQRLLNIAEGTLHASDAVLSELKGASLPPEVLETVVTSFDVTYNDATLQTTNLPWSISYPVRVSIVSMNPEVATQTLTELFRDDLDAPKAHQVLQLITVLDPIFRQSLLDPAHYDEIHVILDAAVWKGPAQQLDDVLAATSSAPKSISFETWDSKKAPGLQLADLCAYAWARHLREGDCGSIVEEIDGYRFAKDASLN